MFDLIRVGSFSALVALILPSFTGMTAWGSTLKSGTIQGVIQFQKNPGAPSPSDFVIFSTRCTKTADLGIPVRISQENCAYKPRLSVAVSGQKLDIRNDDRIIHNSFSVSPVRFDTGQQKPQGSSLFTLSQPGVAKIYCRVHPDMETMVLILRNPCYARPSADGTFVLEGLPNGAVDVRLWSPRLNKVLLNRVQVGKSISTVTFEVKPEMLGPAPRKVTGCPVDNTSD